MRHGRLLLKTVMTRQGSTEENGNGQSYPGKQLIAITPRAQRCPSPAKNEKLRSAPDSCASGVVRMLRTGHNILGWDRVLRRDPFLGRPLRPVFSLRFVPDLAWTAVADSF